MHRPRVNLIVLFCLLVLPIEFLAAQTKHEGSLPDTPAAKQLNDWLRVFAGGDQNEYTRFIADRYTATLLAEDKAHDRADHQARVYMDARRFDIRRIERSTPQEIDVLAKARADRPLVSAHDGRGGRSAAPHHGVHLATHPAPAEDQIHVNERELIQQLGVFMDKLASVDAFAGTVLVAKDDKPIFKRAYGLASKAYNFPMRIDTKLNLASTTKIFTAVAVFQLIEQGKLSLTDTVSKILPDYPNKKVADKITIHHLLSHSSGLGDYHGAKYICSKNVLRQARDYFPLFVDEPLSFEPGEKMQYSNAGYVILGAIIEKVSGENYFDYVRRRIFEPAEMKSTGFFETDIDTPNLATGYTNFEDKGEDYFEFHLGQRRNTSLYSGAKGSSQGGAFSTAEDMLRFSVALHSNKLITAKSFDLMTTPKYFFRKYASDDVYYGYGFELENIDGKRVIGHGGGDLGISSGIRWYPDSGNYTFIVLSNYDRGGIVANDKIQDLIIHSRK